MSQLSTPHASTSAIFTARPHPRPSAASIDAESQRPLKRQRFLMSPLSTGSSDTTMSERPTLFPSSQRGETPTPTSTTPHNLQRPIAADVLGFARSKLSAHAPTNFPAYVSCLREAYFALYPHTDTFQPTPSLDPETRGVEEECKIWLCRAETGLLVLDASSELPVDPTTWGVPVDEVQERVDHAVGKGLVLVQKHVSLRVFRLPLTLASARLAVTQNKPRHALAQLRRLVSTASPSDPAEQTYRAHLALVNHMLEVERDDSAALLALKALNEAAGKRGDHNVQTLCKVERLRVVVNSSRWLDVHDALENVETALGLVFAADEAPAGGPSAAPMSKTGVSSQEESQPSQLPSAEPKAPAAPPPIPTTPWESALTIMALMLGALAWTHFGQAARASARISHLHRLMDARSSWDDKNAAGAIERGDAWRWGIVDMPLGPASTGLSKGHARSQSQDVLTVHTPHPAALFRLTFLVTAATKRDPTVPALNMNVNDDSKEKPSQDPKRRTFAREGLAVADKAPPVQFGPCTSLTDARALNDSMSRMRAQLLLELLAVAILRHEFDEAERRLAQITAYTRNTNIGPPSLLVTTHKQNPSNTLWTEFAPHILLYAGHLAQSQLRPRRARAYYVSAINLAKQAVAVDKAPVISDRQSIGLSSSPPKNLSTTSSDSGIGGMHDVLLAARACDVALRIGASVPAEADWITPAPRATVVGKRGAKRKRPTVAATTVQEEREKDETQFEALPALQPGEADEVVRLCLGDDDPFVNEDPGERGAALKAVGHLLAACCGQDAGEVLKVKNHLKSALEISTHAHDNALRAEILALTSAQYVYTAPAHAHIMLRRARELARELGAAPLAAWVVRRMIEVSRLNGKELRVPKLEEELAELENRVRAVQDQPVGGSANLSKKAKR
ncbi:hypothetical protein BKA62DRAFT_54987 [Auriculariales sp. MPI-PUGE-AT-0066]|nr:hypothetical protein BKA62DRAFT_54987 [Auriculariales sp. MPI-PUGE-AT-0066]